MYKLLVESEILVRRVRQTPQGVFEKQHHLRTLNGTRPMSAAPSTHNEKDAWVPLCVAAIVSTLALAAYIHVTPHDPEAINEPGYVELARHNVVAALVLGAFSTLPPMTLCLVTNEIRKYFGWSKWMICPLMAAIVEVVACIPGFFPRHMSDFTTFSHALRFGLGMFGMTVPFGLAFTLLHTPNRARSK